MGNTLRCAIVCIVIAMGSLAVAGEAPQIDPITPEDYPALLFVQEDLTSDEHERMSLMVATFDGNEPRVQKVIAAQSVKATQLADTVFLLEASHHPKDRPQCTHTFFLVDMSTGRRVLLFRSKLRDKHVHLYCLLSKPDEHKAVLLRYGQGVKEDSLLHVDLKTLQVTEQRKLPMNDDTRVFHSPHMKISPDLRRLAAVVYPNPYLARQAHYSLRVLDMETLQVTELDDDVIVQISPLSSHSMGRPPFEWVSPQEILYQDIVADEAEDADLQSEGQHVLRSVNTKTGHITQWAQKRLRFTGDGGYMRRDWLTGELRYRDFTVDIRERNLREYQPCYSVKHDSKGKELWFQGRRLHYEKGRDATIVARPSRSEEHMAFLARSDSPPTRPALYALTKNMEEPVEVAEASVHTTCVWWIEDTSDLREH